MAGAIAGTVIGPDGKAIANVGVFVFDHTTGALDGIGQTGADGSYLVAGMAPSTGYTVCFNGQNSGEAPYVNHGSECWNNVAWDGNNAHVPAGASRSRRRKQVAHRGGREASAVMPMGAAAPR